MATLFSREPRQRPFSYVLSFTEGPLDQGHAQKPQKNPILLADTDRGTGPSTLTLLGDVVSDEREDADVLGGVVLHEFDEQSPQAGVAKRSQLLAQGA